MLNIPSNMQPTLASWKQNHNLGEGMKFGLDGQNGSSYGDLMDKVQWADNKGAQDSAPEKGLVVSPDDNETIRYSGTSQKGSLEAALPDGSVMALEFTPESIEHLQLTPKDGGVEALAQHFDRSGGHGWMQVGGAVTVIDMDAPGALEDIFGIGKPAATPGSAVGAELATKLGVPAGEVSVASYERKGFNASNCDFAVAGELQMSAWTEGVECKLTADGKDYTYRGLDDKTGRYGEGESPSGYWQLDGRGIYVPAEGPKDDFSF